MTESRDFAAFEVRNYELLARNGRKIRTATMVVFPDGREVRFTERMSKREAIRQAQIQPHSFDVHECPCLECQR